MEKIGGKTFLTVEEAGEYLGVSRTQIFRLLGAGELLSYRQGRRLVPQDTCDEFIERNTVPASR